MNFMKLPDEYAKKDSYFHIIPVAYEGEVTFGKGAAKGPAAILEASEHLEYYDEECKNEPFLHGVYVCPEISEDSEESVILAVSDAVYHVVGFPIVLGGDHSVTIGAVRAQPDDVGVLILDAHSDFRDSWNGSASNHACVAKQASKKHDVLVVGVRSQDADEDAQIKACENMDTIKMHEWSLETFRKKIASLPSKIYLSIDVDCFDPSFIRNTGTPEPGGFTYREVLSMLRILFAEKEVVGADIVEFAPNEHYRAESFSLARLLYKLCAYKVDSSKD
ncbi:MAG: agmatinase [Candidatus Woesearchaeota archaeon]|jgi:agmatinase